MKLHFAAMLAVLLGSEAACAQAPATPKGPKLLVVVSVDQFSAALFNEYRGHFRGGLARMAGGVAFANGFQAHGATETCPGHSTILTGAHPTRNGIVANNWTDFSAPRDDKAVYCAEDERVPGSTTGNYTVSDAHLRVPTLGDRLKRVSPASRVVSVAGKDRSAVMMGGHATDQRWYWKDKAFIQNNAATPAPVAAQVNASVAKAIAEARPELVPPDYCAPRDKAVDMGNGRTIGTFRFQRNAGDAAAFTSSPELDAATLAMAAGLVQQMQLGRGKATDVLAIGLSATDLVGHRYGPGGVEMCLQLASLDKDLGDFFRLLDQSGIDYAAVLTADHGSLDIPERLHARGVADAARLDPSASMGSVSAEIARRLGLNNPVFIGDWYLAPGVPEARRPEVLKLAREILITHPQVDSVYTRTEVGAHPMPKARPENWTVLDRLRASWDPVRTGDLNVVYKPHITSYGPTGPVVAGHGTVWDYDRKVPILFWWPGIAAQDPPESAMTVDIMPTLASLIGLRVPASEIDGHCLDLMPGAADNCR